MAHIGAVRVSEGFFQGFPKPSALNLRNSTLASLPLRAVSKQLVMRDRNRPGCRVEDLGLRIPNPKVLGCLRRVLYHSPNQVDFLLQGSAYCPSLYNLPIVSPCFSLSELQLSLVIMIMI